MGRIAQFEVNGRCEVMVEIYRNSTAPQLEPPQTIAGKFPFAVWVEWLGSPFVNGCRGMFYVVTPESIRDVEVRFGLGHWPIHLGINRDLGFVCQHMGRLIE